MTKDRRLWMITALLLAVALSFWSSSRYPSLDAKSSMSGAVALQDSLSFEAVFNTSTAPDTITQIAYTFGNWVYINWQGMSFGLVIAILLLTALPLIRDSYSRSAFGSSLVGTMIGIPLGLCVNCSAPVAYGIYKGGGRTETALAAMLSSPALNIIVLGMSVALLPAYLWATKLGLSLLLIFVCVPLLVKLTGKNPNNSELKSPEVGSIPASEPCLSMADALMWLVPTLLKNTLSMLWKMLPLMLLAGLLGAVLVTVLPWEKLIDLLPMYNRPLIVAAMLLLALFTLILPVPVAFDIILVAMLVSGGLPDGYAGIMLFALGSFSIYSFFVLLKANLKATAINLMLCVWLLSIASGAIAYFWGQWDAAQQKQLWFEVVKQSKGTEYKPSPLDYKDLDDLAQTPLIKAKPLENLSEITEVKLNQNSDRSLAPWQMQLQDLGLQAQAPPIFWSNMAPYSAFAPLASADINNDGWPDLIKGGYTGIHIYINTGGRFQLIRTPELDSLRTISVLAPADLDNDGDPDLVVALFSGESFIAYNDQGRFEKPIQIRGESISYAPAIALTDLDQNSELDLIFGNQAVLDLMNISTENSVNRLYMQQASRFIETEMPGGMGATLSLLASDVNQDQQTDIFVGNDFDSPDRYYQYKAETNDFEAWRQTTIAETTRTTMSIDTADIDNDLELETYIAQVSIESPDRQYLDVKRQASVYERNYGRLLYGFPNPFGDLRSEPLGNCEQSDSQCAARNARKQISAALRARDLAKCSSLQTEQIMQCAAVAVHEFAYRRGRFTDLNIPCENLGQGYPEISMVCERMSQKNQLRKESKNLYASYTDAFPQNSLTNILLDTAETNQAPLLYQDIAEQMGVQYSGWTWNAKFADLDGDQWQDLFVANGWYQMRTDTSNVFFRNILGEKFEIQTQASGLLDFEPTKSYVYLDIDQDGDLDIVTHNIYGELNAYINQNRNHHIQIELVDALGNRSGVGAKIIIEYGKNNELSQIRELKLSGGYQSFDPVIAHFGLGAHQSVKEINLSFIDGRQYQYSGDFKSGHRYRISLPKEE